MSDETTEYNDEDKDRLISLKEAAELYGLSTSYLRAIARKGRLNAKKFADRWATTPNDIEEYIRTREEKGVFRDDLDIN